MVFASALARGQRPFSQVPLGYRRLDDGSIVIDPIVGPLLAQGLSLLARGLITSQRALIRRLTEHRVPITSSSLASSLLSPPRLHRYAGRLQSPQHGLIHPVPAQRPPLIDDDTYTLLAARAIAPIKSPETGYRQGLVYSGYRPLDYRTSIHESTTYAYYGIRTPETRRSVRAEVLDDAFEKLAQHRILRPVGRELVLSVCRLMSTRKTQWRADQAMALRQQAIEIGLQQEGILKTLPLLQQALLITRMEEKWTSLQLDYEKTVDAAARAHRRAQCWESPDFIEFDVIDFASGGREYVEVITGGMVWYDPDQGVKVPQGVMRLMTQLQ